MIRVRSLLIVALAALVFAQPWMQEGFYAIYHQTVKNSGLFALRGQAYDLTLKYEVVKVYSPNNITLRIVGNVTALINGRNVTRTLNTTVNLDPNWKNVSLPFLTTQKFNELLRNVPKYNKTGDIYTFEINISEPIPNHNMLFVAKGIEKINAKLMILTYSKIESVIYLTKNNSKRLAGTSIVTVTLKEYHMPK